MGSLEYPAVGDERSCLWELLLASSHRLLVDEPLPIVLNLLGQVDACVPITDELQPILKLRY